jgi:hypothetical protein
MTMFGNKLRRKGADNGSSALPERVPEGPGRRDKHYRNGKNQLIECRRLVKTYHSPAGDFAALKEIDLQVDTGENVSNRMRGDHHETDCSITTEGQGFDSSSIATELAWMFFHTNCQANHATV